LSTGVSPAGLGLLHSSGGHVEMIAMKNLFKSSVLAMLVGGSMLIAAPAMAQKGTDPAKPAAKHDEKKEHKAEKTEASAEGKAKVGEKAPAFELKDTDGKTVKLSDFSGKIVVLEWFNPECPFVKKHHAANTTMVDLAKKFASQNVVWVAINSGAPGKEGAGLELSKKAKAEWKLPYPVLIDETGTVGKTYGAKRTPEMYIINKDGTLVYHGAIDDNADAKTLGKVNYVEKALTQVVKGETVTESKTKAYGCSVKY
jgi:peroxiredoxin